MLRGTLANDRTGTGPPLLLIHGTPGSRRIWDPVVAELAERRQVLLIDLPGFGESAPIAAAHLPRDWIGPIGDTLDELGHGRLPVVGHSMGGWVALELALAGRATAVLALAPAGLWSKRSPLATDIKLQAARLASRLGGAAARRALRISALRRMAFRDQSVDAGRVPAEWTQQVARDVTHAPGWPAHFRAARRTRFMGGQRIDVPVRVVFGDRDRIAQPGKSRNTDQLPSHVVMEQLENCGHMVMWDAPERLVAAALATRAAREV